MADTFAVVTLQERRGRAAEETEVRVTTLQELFEVCRSGPASRVVRIAVKGPAGEVRLNFGSFIRKS
ncbi:MAG TPA: hypothetical protein VFO85_08490 [Vicinamibacteria bacterium]|nr:hypothetical protein [Vicinamibacteria bacterium]